MDKVMKPVEEKMEKAFNAMTHSFTKLRTGRASINILDDLKINYYGEPTPIKQIGSISTPEPRLIVIQPWDKTILSDVEKALLAANLGITPENDGNVIRLPFQPLTEEKRKDIVKQIKKIAEDTKIAIRNIRRDTNDAVKKMEKDGELSEDESVKQQKNIQEKTDKWIEKIGEAAVNKEKDVMSV